MLTIVMYEDVHPDVDPPSPALPGLSVRQFEGQLDYIHRHHVVCSPERILAAMLKEGEPLPENACLLTFDDGLQAHRTTVLPRLLRRGLAGCFFPIVDAVENRRVMIVHKVQHMLATRVDREKLFCDLLKRIAAWRDAYELPPTEDLLQASACGVVRCGDLPTAQFKCLLEHVLPRQSAWVIAGELFRKYVTADETGFAETLYLTAGQLREMAEAGMTLGGHGVFHERMESLSRHGQREVMLRSREFLARILGEIPTRWMMNYPYGSCDIRSEELAQAVPGCCMAVTDQAGLVENFSRPYRLSRLKYTELPMSGDAPLCVWTRMVQAPTQSVAA
ncbi:MAG: polysaccharide deacetylase family protein [Magnetococcales bacterium]|nr:polysaccharide deacetylase family protein [Magnetococcales bacterium]